MNNNTQQDEKIKHQLTPFDRSEPQLYCHCTLIDISKTLSKCIHTFSETDVFCSSVATLSILGRVSRPIEAVTIELSIALHRLPSPCLHWRALSYYTRVRSVLYWSRAVSFRVMHAYLNLLNSVHLVQAQPTPPPHPVPVLRLKSSPRSIHSSVLSSQSLPCVHWSTWQHPLPPRASLWIPHTRIFTYYILYVRWKLCNTRLHSQTKHKLCDQCFSYAVLHVHA